MDFLKELGKLLKKEKTNNPKTLKQMFATGLISKEEFLRFAVVRKGMSLEKAETELRDFLNKPKPKIRLLKKRKKKSKK